MVAAITTGALGVTPTNSEQAKAKAWLNQHLLSKGTPAFSFVLDGKSSSELLSTWKATKSTKGPLRVVTYEDRASGLTVRCETKAYAGTSSFEWVVWLENTGKSPTGIIDKLRALDVEFGAAKDKAAVLHRSLGEHNSGASFQPIQDEMTPGKEFVMAPNDGRSSDPFMPFFNLDLGGQGIAVGLGWSGQWEAKFAGTQTGGMTAIAGQQTTHFRLMPGERVRTPRMLLTFWDGKDPLRGNNLMRQTILKEYMPKRDGKQVLAPICATANWTDPDGTYEGPHLAVQPKYARLGIEVFWSDMDPQQWYPLGFYGGTGNYTVDKTKYPNGLEPVADAIKKAGLEFLLWFEPERAQAGTDLDREHPDWLIKLPGTDTRLVNLGNPATTKGMIELLDGFVNRLHLSWLRWDFNMGPKGYWASLDGPERQGITENHYIQGLYKVWDELRQRHPNLVVDLCASGGRRLDIESLQRGVPLWHSDMQCDGAKPAADQLQNGGLWRWVPLHGSGNFGLEPSYEFRSSMTTGNILCAGDKDGLATANPNKAEDVKRTVAIFKKVRPYMLGDFYPLFPHVEAEGVWYGYQFHRADLDAGIAIVFRRTASKETSRVIGLHDIVASAHYEVENHDTGKKVVVTGKQLSSYQLEIEAAPGSAILFYKRVR